MLTIPREGLVAEYYLNGDTVDTSGNGNDGTATDITRIDTDIGYQSKCASFNGDSSKIDCGEGNGSNIYTISFWMFTSEDITSTTSGQGIINTSTNDDGFNGWIGIGDISGYADNETLCIGDGESDNYGRTYIKDVIPAGRHFIIFVFNGETYDIYVDLQKKQTYIGGDPNGTACRALKFNSTYIGKDDEGNYFSGIIQDIRLYDSVLSEKEIKLLYLEGLKKLNQDNNTIPELFKGCVAYYDFRGGDLHNLVTGDKATNNGATLITDYLGCENNAYDINNGYINLGTTLGEKLKIQKFTHTYIWEQTSSQNDDSYGSIFGYNNGDGYYGYRVKVLDDNTVRLSIIASNGGEAYSLTTTNTINIGNINILSIVYNNQDVYINLNGTITTGNSGVDIVYDSTMTPIIGRTSTRDDVGELLFGIVSLGYIYNSALSDSEIKTLHNLLMK